MRETFYSFKYFNPFVLIRDCNIEVLKVNILTSTNETNYFWEILATKPYLELTYALSKNPLFVSPTSWSENEWV